MTRTSLSSKKAQVPKPEKPPGVLFGRKPTTPSTQMKPYCPHGKPSAPRGFCVKDPSEPSSELSSAGRENPPQLRKS